MTEFKRYLQDVVNEYDEFYPNLSWGQVYLTTLYKYRPILVFDIVKNGKFDPFYNDKKINEFLSYVSKNWDTSKTDH
jgi:hypothetical protein